MEDSQNPTNPGQNPEPKPDENQTYTQHFQHQPVSARVPERWSKGVMASGVLVLDGPHEFVLDFFQALTRPHQIVARVILVPAVMQQLVQLMTENLGKYVAAFGQPMELPKSPPKRSTIQEIYDNFKLPEESLSGAYANSMLIGHSAAEFFVDFITGFYPTAAVSTRIIMAAPYGPRMLETLNTGLQQYQRRRIQQHQAFQALQAQQAAQAQQTAQQPIPPPAPPTEPPAPPSDPPPAAPPVEPPPTN